MRRPVANPKYCQSRRRRVARALRRHALQLRKVKLTRNNIKIQRGADLFTLFTLQHLAVLMANTASEFEASIA